MSNETFTIGSLAKAAGVNVETVRYYQRIKLVATPKRASGGIRRYGTGELYRIQFIKTAQGLGFTLDEIADLVKLDGGTRCKDAHDIAALRLADVRKRLRDLRRMEKALARLVRRCETHRGAIRCPLIDDLVKKRASR
jgi:MerR family mercuric resistance operon transcriptional regulator